MTNRDMTRKEFLAYLGSFLGLFILSRLPWGDTSAKTFNPQTPRAYGNDVYGG